MLDLYKKYKIIIFWSLFALILLSQIILQYYGLVRYQYPVPPGDDPVNHFYMARTISNGKSAWSVFTGGGYPPLFHLLMAEISRLFNGDLIKAMLYCAPGLLVLNSLAVFALSRFFFGRKAALLGMALYVFTVRAPYQLLSDGGYPDLLAAHFLLPLAILSALAFIKHPKTNRWYFLVLFFILSFLTLFTHHISSFYLFGIVVLSLPFVWLYQWRDKKWRTDKIYYLIAAYVLFIAAVLLALLKLPAFGAVRGMLQSAIEINGSPPFFHAIGHAEEGSILGPRAVAGLIGYVVFLFGIVGIFTASLKKDQHTYLRLPLVIWAAMLLIGSQFSFLSNPERLARDATFPLSILAGGCILFLWQKLKKPWNWALLVFVLLLAFRPVYHRLSNAYHPDPMLRFSQADVQAINQIPVTDPPMRVLALSCDDWLNIKLPGRSVYLKYDGVPLDWNDTISLDYVYAETNVKSWLPLRCGRVNTDNLLSRYQLKLIDTFRGPNSDILLFENVTRDEDLKLKETLIKERMSHSTAN